MDRANTRYGTIRARRRGAISFSRRRKHLRMSGAWLSSRSARKTAAFWSPQVRTSYVLHAVSENCNQVFRNGQTYVHDRDASPHQSDDALRSVCWKECLCNTSSRWIEGFSGLEHSVHDNCKLASNSHGRAFKAKPFTQLQAPSFEITFGFGAGSR